MKQAGILLLAALLLYGAQRAHTAARPPKLVLTHIQNGLEATPEFSCSDRIHGYLTLSERAVGAHSLEGVWFAPDGTEVEHSKNWLEFPIPGRQTAYVWLELQDNTGGVLGDFRSGGRDREGNENRNGEWRVKVLWDGQALIESKFTVKCS